MKALGCFALFVLIAGCASNVSRGPAADTKHFTRDGREVYVPSLRVPLNIPNCSTERKDLGECIAPAEEPMMDEIVKVSVQFQTLQNPATEKVSQRDFHARHHACLAAKWVPLKDAPVNVGVGIFAQKKVLPAVIRYSNGSPKGPGGLTPPDGRPDARGLAIKVVGVAGDSILNVEDAQPGVMNQDFVLINHPAFFLRKPFSYPQFFSRIMQGKPFMDILDPLELSTFAATNRVIADPSAEAYFSQTPYALGAQNVKYRVSPCQEDKVIPPSEEELKNPRYLRARVAAKLKRAPLCLMFAVQLRTPAMDVEDAVVEWKDSPFVDVARLEIPQKQDINEPSRDRYCEDISFNPWNSLAENRPAGGMNRARLAVYSAVSRKRRLENQVAVREPKASEDFFRVLKLKK